MKVGSTIKVIKPNDQRTGMTGEIFGISEGEGNIYWANLGKGRYGIFKEEEIKTMDKDVMASLDELDEIMSKPTEDSLAQLKVYVEEYKVAKQHIAFLDMKMKKEKEDLNRVSQASIPDLLAQYNLSEMKLGTGEKIKVKQEVSPTIKKGMENTFFSYLEKREEESLIKDTLVIYNPSVELRKLAKEQMLKEDDASEDGTDTEMEECRKIYPQTLKAYCRRRLEKAEEIKEGEESFPPESLSLYVYSKTTIK